MTEESVRALSEAATPERPRCSWCDRKVPRENHRPNCPRPDERYSAFDLAEAAREAVNAYRSGALIESPTETPGLPHIKLADTIYELVGGNEQTATAIIDAIEASGLATETPGLRDREERQRYVNQSEYGKGLRAKMVLQPNDQCPFQCTGTMVERDGNLDCTTKNPYHRVERAEYAALGESVSPTPGSTKAQRTGPCAECGQMTVVIHEKPWARKPPHHARLAVSPEPGLRALTIPRAALERSAQRYHETHALALYGHEGRRYHATYETCHADACVEARAALAATEDVQRDTELGSRREQEIERIAAVPHLPAGRQIAVRLYDSGLRDGVVPRIEALTEALRETLAALDDVFPLTEGHDRRRSVEKAMYAGALLLREVAAPAPGDE
jgi:DNA-binding MarR family transcriptional regulator